MELYANSPVYQPPIIPKQIKLDEDYNWDEMDKINKHLNSLLKNIDSNKKEITVVNCYKELFLENYTSFILSSGRCSGKTMATVSLIYYTWNKYKDKDIVILLSTAGEIQDSIGREIVKYLSAKGYDVGEGKGCEFKHNRKVDRIWRPGWKGVIRVYAISDAKGGQRTRGKATSNPISLLLLEEVQKNKDSDIVEHALTTFKRNLMDGAKTVLLGNNESIGHWYIDYVKSKELDKNWKIIYASYKDIWGYLNEDIRGYINGVRVHNPIEYERIFMGNIYASNSDVVFPMFDKKKIYMEREHLPKNRINMVFVGIDHATANDRYVIAPLAILDNGRGVVLEIFCDDPQEQNRSIALSTQAGMATEFLTMLDEKYGFSYNNVPVHLVIDGASDGIYRELLLEQRSHMQRKARQMWRNTKIHKYTMKGAKSSGLNLLRNVFGYGTIDILNEGTRDWKGDINKHYLVKEIESLRFKNGKLDPKIKNDCCDALEYACGGYYKNCFNLSYPLRMSSTDIKINHYNDIRRLMRYDKVA